MRIKLITLCCIPNLALAFFCPNNFAQIDFGNTIDQVKQACGKPDKEVTKDAEEKVPQEWTYYIPQPPSALPPGNLTPPAPAMLKATMTFDKDGKVIYMAVNGLGLGESTFCANPVQLGATIDQVKSACGKPEMITKQKPETDDSTHAPPSKTTELTYGSTKLIFTNGILTSK